MTKTEEVEGIFRLCVEVDRNLHAYLQCGEVITHSQNYRAQKIKHLKVFERTAYLFYRKRRYICRSGKRFYEACQVVDRYYRHTKEWNQVLGLWAIRKNKFKDTAVQFQTSPSTAIRRFD